jgi:hypothetical protein
MSKSLPVYELGQWITTTNKIGYVVARSIDGVGFEIDARYVNDPHVMSMGSRGNGYCIAWGELQDEQVGNGSVARFTMLRLRWLRADTIAEKRYQPCENPVKVPVVQEVEQDDEGDEVTEFERTREGVVTFGAPSQPVLPLDIDPEQTAWRPYVDPAAESAMRAAVALGNQAADWLRAKGLTL